MYFFYQVQFDQDLDIARTLGEKSGRLVFSHHLLKMTGAAKLFIMSEPFISHRPTKNEARAKFSLPQEGAIALALGFRTAIKGWDVLVKMKIPDGWSVVVSSSKNLYNKENPNLQLEKIITSLSWRGISSAKKISDYYSMLHMQ
jgi:hypothetical protein